MAGWAAGVLLTAGCATSQEIGAGSGPYAREAPAASGDGAASGADGQQARAGDGAASGADGSTESAAAPAPPTLSLGAPVPALSPNPAAPTTVAPAPAAPKVIAPVGTDPAATDLAPAGPTTTGSHADLPAPTALDATSTVAAPLPTPTVPTDTSTTTAQSEESLTTAVASTVVVSTTTVVLSEPTPVELETGEGASFSLLNARRASVDGAALVRDAEMDDFAREWSRHMAESGAFEHSTGPFAENIAFTSDPSVSAAEAADLFHGLWIESADHDRNMTNASFTKAGIGLYRTAQGWYGTHVFSVE